MTYLEDLKQFQSTYSYNYLNIDGTVYDYILTERKEHTIVFLNGGMNTLKMWMKYVDALSNDYQILLFNYPVQLKTNQELVQGMHGLFKYLHIFSPIFIGASDGGMVAQIYTQKYPMDVGSLILISTGGMDCNTLKSLRRKYFLAPLMLWYMKHCNYEKLKPKLIQASLSHLKNEAQEEKEYAKDMFETIFKGYTQTKDVHISGLLADVMHQKPVVKSDFRNLKNKFLLILPVQDFFSKKMQEDLISLMYNPRITYISGGHLSTVLKVNEYVCVIKKFLLEIYNDQA